MKLYHFKTVLLFFLLYLLLSCDFSVNSLLEDVEGEFNPELTEMYNSVMKEKDSEYRIIAMFHYSLIVDAISYLDTTMMNIASLDCSKDFKNNCVLKYLKEDINGGMLYTQLETTKGNFSTVVSDSNLKKEIIADFNSFGSLENVNDWMLIEFGGINSVQAIEKLMVYKKLINKNSILVMKDIINNGNK